MQAGTLYGKRNATLHGGKFSPRVSSDPIDERLLGTPPPPHPVATGFAAQRVTRFAVIYRVVRANTALVLLRCDGVNSQAPKPTDRR